MPPPSAWSEPGGPGARRHPPRACVPCPVRGTRLHAWRWLHRRGRPQLSRLDVSRRFIYVRGGQAGRDALVAASAATARVCRLLRAGRRSTPSAALVPAVADSWWRPWSASRALKGCMAGCNAGMQCRWLSAASVPCCARSAGRCERRHAAESWCCKPSLPRRFRPAGKEVRLVRSSACCRRPLSTDMRAHSLCMLGKESSWPGPVLHARATEAVPRYLDGVRSPLR